MRVRKKKPTYQSKTDAKATIFWDTKRSLHTTQSQLTTAESFSQKLGLTYKYGSAPSTVKNKLLYVTHGFISVRNGRRRTKRVAELLKAHRNQSKKEVDLVSNNYLKM